MQRLLLILAFCFFFLARSQLFLLNSLEREKVFSSAVFYAFKSTLSLCMELILADLVMHVGNLLVEATSTALNATSTSAGTADMCCRTLLKSIQLNALCVEETYSRLLFSDLGMPTHLGVLFK
jgi:hypothetical protein